MFRFSRGLFRDLSPTSCTMQGVSRLQSDHFLVSSHKISVLSDTVPSGPPPRTRSGHRTCMLFAFKFGAGRSQAAPQIRR